MLREIDPHEVMTDDSLIPVLREVNAIRAAHSQPALLSLPLGVPQESRACPIYHALRDCWPSSNIRVHIDAAGVGYVGIAPAASLLDFSVEKEFPFSDYITDFINLFDMVSIPNEAPDND
jgi:hypothetical protein